MYATMAEADKNALKASRRELGRDNAVPVKPSHLISIIHLAAPTNATVPADAYGTLRNVGQKMQSSNRRR